MKLGKKLVLGMACAVIICGTFVVFVPRVWGAMFCIGGWCVDNWGTSQKSSVKGGRLCINGEGNCVKRGQLLCSAKGGDNDDDGICNTDDECENHSGVSTYQGCPEEAPEIYHERYDPSDKKVHFDVRGDSAQISASGAGKTWTFSDKGVGTYTGYAFYDLPACGPYVINLVAIPEGKRKIRNFSEVVSVDDIENICQDPSIHHARYDSSDKKIHFDVHGDRAQISASGAGKTWTWDDKRNGTITNYTFWDLPACGDYTISVTALDQVRHPGGTVPATVNVNDTINICPRVDAIVSNWSGCSGCGPKTETRSCIEGSNGGTTCAQLGGTSRSCTLPTCIASEMRDKAGTCTGVSKCDSDKCGRRNEGYVCGVEGAGWWCSDGMYRVSKVYRCDVPVSFPPINVGLPSPTLDPCLNKPSSPSCMPIPGRTDCGLACKGGAL